MTIKGINGKDIELVNDKENHCVFFPNPAKAETAMGLWNDLFGIDKAKIMRHNYLSHAKNGFVENGEKVRKICNFDGEIIKELPLKEETEKTGSAKVVNNGISVNDAIAVYNEIKGKPGLEKACEMQFAQINLLIPEVIKNASIDLLQFVIKQKKEEEAKKKKEEEEAKKKKEEEAKTE